MKAALQALATSPNAVGADFSGLREQALELLKFRGSLISVRERGGQLVMNTLVPPGQPLPVSRDPVLLAADERVFATGQPTVSDLYMGTVRNEPFVLVDVPLSRDGQVLYAMNMAIAPDAILEILSGARMPKDWIVSILDGNDRVVARSKSQDEFIGKVAPPSFAEPAAGIASGRVDHVTALDGTKVFTAFDTSDVSRWRIVVSVPRTILGAPIRNLILMLGAIILFALVTSAFLARRYSLQLERQVRSLQAVAAATGKDGQPARAPGFVTELEGIAAALRDADVSLKERDRHKDLLLAELNHRVRNTLSVLLSVVGNTIRNGDGQEALARKTAGRIMALSRAHDLLSSADWAPIALSDLVARTSEQEQLAIAYEGPEIEMRPEAVAPLAQALHELAVNERTYGASGGRTVTVRTELSNDSARINWSCNGRYSGAEFNPGFGIRLVRLCLERQLFGSIERIDADGMTAILPRSFVTGGAPSEPFAARLRKRS